MTLYEQQHRYFEKAYRTGKHGWPVVEPTPFVIRSLKNLIKERQLSKGSRVLDLGCGEGRHTLASAELGLRAVGLDYQFQAITRARAMPKAAEVGRGYSFLVGDAFHLPFRSASFNLIIDFGCFHHVKKVDARRYLQILTKSLVPMGYFILSCFSTKFRHYPGERRKRDWVVHSGHYDRFFRKTDIRSLFGRDFSILEIKEEVDGHYSFYQSLMEKKV